MSLHKKKLDFSLAIWASTCRLSHGPNVFSYNVISAKLLSCLDQLHSILGESLHEPTAVTAIIQSNFDTEKALDHIFSQGIKYNFFVVYFHLYCQLCWINHTNIVIDHNCFGRYIL